MTLRALLVGINEFAPSDVPSLRGCVNDVLQMRSILHDRYAFAAADVRVLTDAEATAGGIREGLAWLLSGYGGGGTDVRFFHFSSHGTHVADADGDEPDDEVIVTADHDWDRPFRDDDLAALFAPIPDDVNFTFLADCCHSGTIQRDIEILPRFVPPPDAELRRINARQSALAQSAVDAFQASVTAFLGANPAATPADLQAVTPQLQAEAMKRLARNRFGAVRTDRHVLMAACQDRQTSADARIDGAWQGAFTWSVATTLAAAASPPTYGALLAAAGEKLKDRFTQIPQLECPTALADRPFLTPLAAR